MANDLFGSAPQSAPGNEPMNNFKKNGHEINLTHWN